MIYCFWLVSDSHLSSRTWKANQRLLGSDRLLKTSIAANQELTNWSLNHRFLRSYKTFLLFSNQNILDYYSKIMFFKILRCIYCNGVIMKVQNATCSSNYQNTSKYEGEDSRTMTSGKFSDSKCLSLINQSVWPEDLDFSFFSLWRKEKKSIHLFQMCKPEKSEGKNGLPAGSKKNLNVFLILNF